MTGGQFDNTGTSVIADTFTIQGVDFTNAGNIYGTNNALAGDLAIKVLGNGSLTNNGTIISNTIDAVSNTSVTNNDTFNIASYANVDVFTNSNSGVATFDGKLTVSSSATNNGTITLNGADNTIADMLNSGTINVNGNTSATKFVQSNGTTNVASGITLNLGTTSSGSVAMTAGEINNAGTVTVMTGSFTGGSVKGSGELRVGDSASTVTFENKVGIENAVVVTEKARMENTGAITGNVSIDGTRNTTTHVLTSYGTLSSNLANLTGTITNNGHFELLGDLTDHRIYGTGDTILQGTSTASDPNVVNVTSGAKVDGVLNLNSKTLNMQDSVATTKLNVGSIAGTGSLKLDVNMSSDVPGSDTITLTGTDIGNSGTLTVTGINVTNPIALKSAVTKTVTFVKTDGGTLDGLTTLLATNYTDGDKSTYRIESEILYDAENKSVSTSGDGIRYDFVNGEVTGTLNVTATNIATATIKDFFEGNTIYLMSAPDTPIDLDEVASFDYQQDSEHPQTIYVNSTLTTEWDKTLDVANNKAVNFNSGYLLGDYTEGAVLDGIVVANKYKLSLNNGTLAGFKDAVVIEQGGELNLSGMSFATDSADNVTDINNAGKVNFSDNNSATNIVNTGAMVNTGTLNVGSSTIAGKVTGTGSFANAGTFTLTGSDESTFGEVENTGTINIDSIAKINGAYTQSGNDTALIKISAGSSLDLASSSTVSAGTVDVNANGTLSSSADLTFDGSGILSNAGTLNQDAGKLTYASSATSTNSGNVIVTGDDTTDADMIISGSGTLTNTATGTIAGGMTSSTTDAPSYETGNFDISIQSGTISNLGSIYARNINVSGGNLTNANSVFADAVTFTAGEYSNTGTSVISDKFTIQGVDFTNAGNVYGSTTATARAGVLDIALGTNGTLTNNGTIITNTINADAGTIVTNNASLDVASIANVATLINNADGNSTFGGKLTVSTSATNTGTMTVNGADNSIADMQNSGTFNVNGNTSATKFEQTNGTTKVASGTALTLGTNSSNSVAMTDGTIDNSGTVTVMTGSFTGGSVKGTSGELRIGDSASTVTFENKVGIENAVVVTEKARMENTGAITGDVSIDGTRNTTTHVLTSYGTLSSNLANLTGKITNNGHFELLGDLTDHRIYGTGDTILQGTSTASDPNLVNVASGAKVDGVLNLNSKTLNMQDSVATTKLSVGSISGAGNLNLDVDMSSYTSDTITLTGTEIGNSGNLTVTGINVTAVPTNLKSSIEKTIVYVNTNGGTLDGLSTYLQTNYSNGESSTYRIESDIIYNSSLNSVTASGDGIRYDFTNGDVTGTLNVLATNIATATIKDFFKGNTVKVLSGAEYIDVDLDNVASFDYVSGTPQTIYVNETLTTAWNKNLEVANTKAVNFNSGYLLGDYADGVALDGIVVANGYKLTLNAGTIAGFDNAIKVNEGGNLTLNNMSFGTNSASNAIDIDNAGDLNFTGTNTATNIANTGAMVNAGTLNVGSSTTAGKVTGTGSLANAGTFNLTGTAESTFGDVDNTGKINFDASAKISGLYTQGANANASGADVEMRISAGHNLDMQSGVDVSYGTFDVASGAYVNAHADSKFSGASKLINAGTYNQTTGKLEFLGASSGENAGKVIVTGDDSNSADIIITGTSTLTNTGTIAGKFAENVASTGKLDILVGTGILSNQGKIYARNFELQANGEFENSETGTAVIADTFTINGASFTNEGKIYGNATATSGTLAINVTNAGENTGSLTNTGTIIANTLNAVTGTQIINSKTLNIASTSNVDVMTNNANGVATFGGVLTSTGKVTNAGTVNLNADGNTLAELENSKVLNVNGNTSATLFKQTTGGETNVANAKTLTLGTETGGSVAMTGGVIANHGKVIAMAGSFTGGEVTGDGTLQIGDASKSLRIRAEFQAMSRSMEQEMRHMILYPMALCALVLLI